VLFPLSLLLRICTCSFAQLPFILNYDHFECRWQDFYSLVKTHVGFVFKVAVLYFYASLASIGFLAYNLYIDMLLNYINKWENENNKQTVILQSCQFIIFWVSLAFNKEVMFKLKGVFHFMSTQFFREFINRKHWLNKSHFSFFFNFQCKPRWKKDVNNLPVAFNTHLWNGRKICVLSRIRINPHLPA